MLRGVPLGVEDGLDVEGDEKPAEDEAIAEAETGFDASESRRLDVTEAEGINREHDRQVTGKKKNPAGIMISPFDLVFIREHLL